MAEVVRAKVTGTGAGNVDVVEAGSLSYEHAGDPPDFVFTRNALHQLPDFWKGVAPARIASLLPAGGILRLHDLVFDFEPADAETRIEAWCAQGSAQSPTERSPFRPIHPALPRDFRTLPGCYLLRFSDRIRRADGRKGRGNGSSSL